MESINKKVLIMAVIMAVFTSSLIYVYIKKATSRTEAIVSAQVFVAAVTMPEGHIIGEEDLIQASVPEEYINPGVPAAKTEIIGKRVRSEIIKGEQILAERLAEENISILSFNIPEGKRAISINVNEQIEVANLIRPGDFIDIIAAFDATEITESYGKILYPNAAKIVLQNIEILSLGQNQVVEDGKQKELPKTVTLAVTPEEAEKLVYVTEYSRIRMVLRSVGDAAIIETPGIIRDDIAPVKGALTLPR